MGDLALTVAPAKPFSTKPKITKGKGHNKWQQRQCKKKEAAISEWTKPAQLVLVQVHGSCEDERMFSAMSYLQKKL